MNIHDFARVFLPLLIPSGAQMVRLSVSSSLLRSTSFNAFCFRSRDVFSPSMKNESQASVMHV